MNDYVPGVGRSASRWKGDKATYNAIHKWVAWHWGKAKTCQNPNCKKRKIKSYDWANKSGKYLRVRDDWVQLCRSCHYNYDVFNKFNLKEIE